MLHPRETRSETGTLLWREQRRVTLSLLCGLRELFQEGEDLAAKQHKVLAVHHAQVQRRGTLYNKRNHQAVGLPSAGLGLAYRRSVPLRDSVRHLDSR